MSEHQYVAFRALDHPVSKKDLAYMRTQSSHAEITPLSFDSEYNYGDFHGNALEMLRRGYDLHLHYANFGIRKLLIRFPRGLPNASAVEPYFADGSLQLLKDNRGPGRILCIKPFHEPGDLDNLWNFDDLLNRLLPLRSEILDGDLRPLYLAHLVMARDGEHDPAESKEGPVPAGLGKTTDAQRALMGLYQLSDALVSAAAKGGPPLAVRDDVRNRYPNWVQRQSQAKKDEWLARLMSDADSAVRREITAEFQEEHQIEAWPTVFRGRTMAELDAAADEIQIQMDHKSAQTTARRREKMLANMAANPGRTLDEVDKLVQQRSRQAYSQIGNLLSDLREALAGTAQSGLAAKQAVKLKKENPKLHLLVSELRHKGLL